VANKNPLSNKIGRALDSFIKILAPGAGLKRQQARSAGDILRKSRFKSYKGAEKGRMQAYWNPGGGSADYDNLTDLVDLRDRSRDIIRNDALAAGIVLTFTTNVVGTGIKPQSRFQSDDADFQSKFQEQAEIAWAKWVDYADAGERQNFYGLQSLIFQQTLENGEPFVLVTNDTKNKQRPYPLALHVIEADRINTPPDKTSDSNIRMGIELGPNGQEIAFHVRNTHPGDYDYNYKKTGSNNYMRIPAKQPNGRPAMMHFYKQTRAGQSRGVPLLSPVLGLFKDLSEYIEAELVANLMAACFGVFIKSENPTLMADNYDQTNGRGQKEIYFEPGMVEYLGPGEEITSFMPQRPGAQFDSFVVRIIRSIGAAIGFPLELIAKDFSQTNYSSARAALLEARRVFQQWQAWLSSSFNQPIWEMVLEEAYLKGDLDAPGFYDNFYNYTKARWVPPGWQWVDPLKEVKAAVEALDNGIESLADVSAAQGKDWEETIEQKAREARKIKDLEEKYDIVIIKNGSQGDDENDNINKDTE